MYHTRMNRPSRRPVPDLTFWGAGHVDRVPYSEKAIQFAAIAGFRIYLGSGMFPRILNQVFNDQPCSLLTMRVSMGTRPLHDGVGQEASQCCGKTGRGSLAQDILSWSPSEL